MPSYFSPPAIPHPGSDLEHPHDVIHTLTYVVQGLCISVATVFVALRLISRRATSAWFAAGDEGW